MVLVGIGRANGQQTYDAAALQQRHAARHDAAVAQARQRVDEAGASSRAHLALADAYLRRGDVKQAVEHFDRVVAMEPAIEPQLWQRGIALYFAGRYEDGRRQFETHRTVNPNDVENAAWHYLCTAKASDAQRARQSLMKIVGDPRPPMTEIMQYLRGGPRSAIAERVAGLAENPAAQASAQFYADLYLGLAADAAGDRGAAEQAIRRAAQTPATHYMADVARVYAQWLDKP